MSGSVTQASRSNLAERVAVVLLIMGIALLVLSAAFYALPEAGFSDQKTGSLTDGAACIRIGLISGSADVRVTGKAHGPIVLVFGITTNRECNRWSQGNNTEPLSLMTVLAGSTVSFTFAVKSQDDYSIVVAKMGGEESIVGYTVQYEVVTYPFREYFVFLPGPSVALTIGALFVVLRRSRS